MTSNSDPQVPKDVAGSPESTSTPSSTEVTEATSPATTVPEDSLVLWIFCVILCSCPMSTLCFRSVPPPLCRTHLLPWIPWSRLWLCLRKSKPIQLLFLGTMVMWTPHRHLGMNPVCKDFKNSLLHKADGNIFLFFVLVPCFTKYSQQSRKGDHPTCLIRGGCRWWPFCSACFGFWWGYSGERGTNGWRSHWRGEWGAKWQRWNTSAKWGTKWQSWYTNGIWGKEETSPHTSGNFVFFTSIFAFVWQVGPDYGSICIGGKLGSGLK